MSNVKILASTCTDLRTRQKNIEDVLDKIEKEYSKHIQPEVEKETFNREVIKQQKLKMKMYKSEESIFKKPYISPSRIRIRNEYMPDFKLHPHKWKRYSLNDVTSEQLSETTNASTAFSFLKSLEQRKKCVADNMDVDCNFDVKPTFKKPGSSKLIQKQAIRDEKNTFSGSKRIMPEYVIGDRRKQKKEKHPVANENNLQPSDRKTVQLSYITEYDDE